jgi:putative membrane protein
MKLTTLVLSLAVLVPTLAHAEDKSTTEKTKPAQTDKDTKKTEKAAKLGESDTKIVAHMHHVNMMEIDMGKRAQRVGSPAVKRYSEMLIKDHQASDKELTSFAKQRGVAKIPAEQAETDADKAEMKQMTESMDGLKKLKGADFDREFLRLMVDSHDKELAKSDQLISSSSDSELKTLIENRKATLQRHSDKAKELQKGNAQATK